MSYIENLEKQLFSERTLAEMWKPQTILNTGSPGPYNTNFAAYGLGWVITDIKGHKQVSHTGGLAGIVTQTTLIPDLDLAILVYTNQQVGAAFSAISNTIKDGYLGAKANDDWIDFYKKRVDAGKKEADEIVAKVDAEIKKNSLNISKPNFEVKGVYVDQWFGEAEVSEKNGQLWFTSKRSKNLTGPMHYYKGNTYIVRWTDRSMDADAYLIFTLDKEGVADGINVSAISPLTDFSFDFQDLDFKKK